MSIVVEVPSGREALTEFVLFHDRVAMQRAARWTAFLPLDLPFLMGESPFSHERTIRPLVVRERGELRARVVAVLDHAYQRHWNERLGHVVMFEALPDSRDAVRALMDAASEWLRAQGADAVRSGFGVLEMPFVMDDYTTLPPMVMRQNPAYYHALLKDAGFETEQGYVDYKIPVSDALVARWESALEAARRGGFRIVPLRDIAPSRRAGLIADLLNECFARHFGWVPTTADEQALLFGLFEATGFLDTTVVAYRGDEAVGECMIVPETSALAALGPGRVLAPEEKVNFLGIGVRETARGRGVNLAMAAYGFTELVRRGARWLSYTLVLDDNWPSRRTAEKLGAHVCANYVCYRRRLTRGAAA